MKKTIAKKAPKRKARPKAKPTPKAKPKPKRPARTQQELPVNDVPDPDEPLEDNEDSVPESDPDDAD